MKLPILILSFFAVTSAIHAQSPRIETFGDRRTETYTYKRGGDATRYTILGKNDTLQTAEFYPNGKIEYIYFKEDTTYYFGELGHLIYKHYSSKNKETKSDSFIHFYRNGQVSQYESYKNGMSIDRKYTKNGQLIITTVEKTDPSVFRRYQTDRNGILIHSNRVDTIKVGEEIKTLEYDTVFHDNGRVLRTSKKDNKYHSFGEKWYDKNGLLIDSIPADSLKLIVFKDNVDCFYGLKKRRGDTIVEPKFDRIDHVLDDAWAAYRGESLILLDRNGVPMSLFPKNLTKFQFLYNMNDKNETAKNPDNEDLDMRNIWTNNATNYYAFSQGDKHGIVTGKGEIVLAPQYFNLSVEVIEGGKYSHFKTRQYKKDGATGFYHEINGLFNARTKRWLLDTSKFTVDNDYNKSDQFFVIQNIQTKKMGIMDTTGSYILPIAYDTVGIADARQGLFWIKKDKKYQILSIEKGRAKLHAPKYEFLVGIAFHAYEFSADDNYVCFVAKQKGKWGVVDAADKIIKPFESDYGYVEAVSEPYFILVKDGQAAKYDLQSLPYEANWQAEYSMNQEFLRKINTYKLIDNADRVFFANDTGKVIIPPQYKLILDDFYNGFGFVEDDKKNKKIVMSETGQIIDYPFHYSLKAADARSRMMIVSDTSINSIGIVSTDGKLLIPCVNYAAAYGDAAQSVFFVKRDTPVLEGMSYRLIYGTFGGMRRDSLDEEDINWQMFDGNGKELTTKPFRFAIRFRQGVGIGMQDAGFNLYKNDGTILTPFHKNVIARNEATEGSSKNENKQALVVNSYTNIRRDAQQGTYALFYNQGLTPAMIVTKADGEILVENGRYDGISKFYGKYALVTAASKVGLIDTFGREIIAPQDLRTYTGHFMDSLNLVNAEHDKMVKAQGYSSLKQVKQPIYLGERYDNIPHPDSLAITTAQRTILWNLLLEKTFDQTILTASDIKIEHLMSNMNSPAMDNYLDNLNPTECRPAKYIVEDSSFAFVLKKKDALMYLGSVFYNFYRKNNRWEELKINDLLQVQGEKRWLLNDLITKKVKALKDQSIDCSNAEAFITTVENRFMLTKTGVDFCFDSTGSGREFVVISFTWAELGAFLKMRIY
jgi:WG containing repeat